MRISNKKYVIKTSFNKKIVLISDIHYYNKKDIPHLNKVLSNIKKIKPDFICIPGDIIDIAYIQDKQYLLDWLTKLSYIAKTIITLGNHEFYINKKEKEYGIDKELFEAISNIDNVCFLDNKNIVIDNINFIGITLDMNYYFTYNISDKYLKDNLNIKKDNYKILLIHSPIKIYDKDIFNKVDLILSGHTHGGVVPNILRPIFKHNGLINPRKQLFPKNIYGYLKNGNTNTIITSGIRVISHINKFRFVKNLFSSEIVTIYFE